MKLKFNIAILLLVAGLVSCKKDPLPELPESNDPYYSIRGLVNNDSINWVVGVDGTTLTYGTGDMNGIETYYGQINSGTSDMAVRFEILRPEVVYDGQTIGAIKTTDLKYLVHQEASVKFNFGMNYSQFNYVLVKNDSNDFEFMNQVALNEFGLHTLTLKFTDYSSTESFNLPIPFGFENNVMNAYFQSESNSDTLIVTPEVAEGDHTWFINGQEVSDQPVLESVLTDGIYQVRHKLKDVFGNIAEHTTLVRMKDGEFYWQLTYHYLDPYKPVTHYGDVIVSIRKDNIWYTSEKGFANLSKPFAVEDVATIIDQQFQPVSTMFDFDFGVMLYNESQTDSLSLPQMVGSVNVGLK